MQGSHLNLVKVGAKFLACYAIVICTILPKSVLYPIMFLCTLRVIPAIHCADKIASDPANSIEADTCSDLSVHGFQSVMLRHGLRFLLPRGQRSQIPH